MNLGISKYMIVGQYHLCLGDLKLRYIYKQFYIWTSLCTERHLYLPYLYTCTSLCTVSA